MDIPFDIGFGGVFGHADRIEPVGSPAGGPALLGIGDRDARDDAQAVNRLAIDAELDTLVALLSVEREYRAVRSHFVTRLRALGLECRDRGDEPPEREFSADIILPPLKGRDNPRDVDRAGETD